MEFDALSNRVIGCAIEVHRHLGPGLLESTYQRCLAHELRSHNIPVHVEWTLPVRYKGVAIDCGYKVYLLVDDALVVELKSVEVLLPVHDAQLMTYMKLGEKPLGLLMNFNVPLLKDNLKRFVI